MNNNIKYASKKLKDKQKRKLYNCVRVSIVAGCVYIVALATGFSYLKNKKSEARDETVIETIEEDGRIIHTETTAFAEISSWGSYDTAEFDKIISLSKDDLKYYDGDDLREYDIKCTPGQFSELIGEQKVKYDECVEALYKNKNLDSNIYKILFPVLDNIKYAHQLDGTNFAVLKHNLEHFTVCEVYDEEDYISKFDPYECCVYINRNKVTDDIYEYALIKAIIGYGISNAYIELDGKKVLCTTAEYCFYNSYDSIKEPKIVKMGELFEDGLAEGVTSLVRQLPVDCNNSLCKNSEDAYILSKILKIRKIQASYYINDGYSTVLEVYKNYSYSPNFRYIIRDFDLYGNKFETTLSLYDEYTRYVKNGLDSYYEIEKLDISKKEMLLNTIKDNMECNSVDEFHIIVATDPNKISPQSLLQFTEPYIDILCKEEDKTK